VVVLFDMVNLGFDYHVKIDGTAQLTFWRPSPFILHIQEITTEYHVQQTPFRRSEGSEKAIRGG
jgi:hypothetical protein